MNNTRRKALNKIAERLREINSDLQELRDEEEEYMENIPENLQDGEKYQAAEAAIDSMDYALDEFEGMITNIEEATGE